MNAKTLLAAAALTLAAGTASAQNFLNMDISRMYGGMVADNNRVMNNVYASNMQAILNNPGIMSLNAQGVCGPGLSPMQFAQRWSALGGCTAQGYAAYNGVTNQIGQDQRRAMDGYHRSVDQSRAAYNGWTGGYAANQGEAGRVLGGTMTYQDPRTGTAPQLQYLQPGQRSYDSRTGTTYSMLPNGQYVGTDSRGNSYALYPAGRVPR